MRTTKDGKGRARAASEKRSEHTRTGTQISLETGLKLNESRAHQAVQSNVQVDVRKK